MTARAVPNDSKPNWAAGKFEERWGPVGVMVERKNAENFSHR